MTQKDDWLTTFRSRQLRNRQEIVQYLKQSGLKYVEIVSVWQDDEDHIESMSFVSDSGEFYHSYDESMPDNFSGKIDVWDLIDGTGVYRIYPDGRCLQVGEAYIPEPELEINRYSEGMEIPQWQIPPSTL